MGRTAVSGLLNAGDVMELSCAKSFKCRVKL